MRRRPEFRRDERRRDGEPSRPLAIVDESGNRRVVVATCEAASANGVRVGMSLAEANVMCAGLTHVPHEPERDAAALAALARWMAMRFTPIVAIEPPNALFLEIGGCERLFGGLSAIVERVRESLRAFRIHAKLAVASTPGAAWAFAMYGMQAPQVKKPMPKRQAWTPTARTDFRVPLGDCGLLRSPQYLFGGRQSLPPGGIQDAGTSRSDGLQDLPPAALRIAPEIADTLNKLGVTTIRQLVGLPRDALPSRFGKELLLRIDQALGRVPEPLVAVECRTPIVVSREWDGPVEALEVLASVLDDLSDEAIEQLARRGHGARQIEVTMRCPYALPITKKIALSRPSRERKNLRRLLRCMLESIEATEGFNGIKLRVARAEPMVAARQASLVDGESESAGDEVEGLVERLKIRLGDASLEQAQLKESHLPEQAVRYLAVEELPAVKASRRKSASTIKSDGGDQTKSPPTSSRPLQLLIEPVEVRTMVSPSEDREGHPISFTHEGNVHRLRITAGPERVSGVWWLGDDKTRDYFDVTDQEGRRFWIFRVIETWKWYVHGVF